jgi:hypothetical protein
MTQNTSARCHPQAPIPGFLTRVRHTRGNDNKTAPVQKPRYYIVQDSIKKRRRRQLRRFLHKEIVDTARKHVPGRQVTAYRISPSVVAPIAFIPIGIDEGGAASSSFSLQNTLSLERQHKIGIVAKIALENFRVVLTQVWCLQRQKIREL